MQRAIVDMIHRQGDTYVAFDAEDRTLGKAGALNFEGTPVSLHQGDMLHVGGVEKTVRVESDMHKDGVMFIE